MAAFKLQQSFMPFDTDREEAFLNRMSLHGFMFTGKRITGLYTFCETEPREDSWLIVSDKMTKHPDRYGIVLADDPEDGAILAFKCFGMAYLRSDAFHPFAPDAVGVIHRRLAFKSLLPMLWIELLAALQLWIMLRFWDFVQPSPLLSALCAMVLGLGAIYLPILLLNVRAILRLRREA